MKMKTSVLLFFISLTLFNVNTFEYHEEYNTEDIYGRSLDENYRELGEETFSYYEPVETLNVPRNDDHVPNYIPDDPSVKHSDPPQASGLPEVTSTKDSQQDSKKPFYEEKDAPELFNKFIKDFNKQYKDEEEYKNRYQNFVNNLKEINRLNKEEDATFDINMFADLGEGESVIG